MNEQQHQHQETHLASLRTAKRALDDGLITQEDFDVVKKAFVNAFQIKAGLDAGFIREEDYDRVRDSFLHSLDFATSTVPTLGLATTNSAPQPRAAAAPPPAQAVPRNAAMSLATAPAAARYLTPPRGGSMGAAAPAAAAAAAAPAPSASGQVPFPVAAAAAHTQQEGGGASGGSGTVEIPADLSRFLRGPSAAGKKSMAGIGLSDTAVAIFNCIKTKSAHKWVTYKIDDAGHEVVIDNLGAQHATFEDFVAALPATFSRYGVYDYAYTNADTGSTVNKLVFIHWAPDSSTTRSKMMYASTKDFFKGFLDGIGAEMQATEVAELNVDEMRERVGQAITRK